MLNFCPYEGVLGKQEFRKLQEDNLAYELVFMKGHSLAELKNTVIGDAKYIEKDEKREKTYMDTSVRYILKAADFPGEKSGIQKLLETIDKSKENTIIAPQTTSTDVGVLQRSSVKTGGKKLEYEKTEDGYYVFSYVATGDTDGEMLMWAYPCCPSCHGRLPKGWFSADAFCPIDFMGGTGSGKTTLLLSLIANDWSSLKKSKGKEWKIIPAHEKSKGDDFWYTNYVEMAENMTKKTSQRQVCYCPGNTQTEKWVSPVFLRATYKGKKIIVGLYDNSGETHQNYTTRDAKVLVLSNMFAHIYLIEPSQMQVSLPKKKTSEKKETVSEVTIMSIEEQGKFQEEHYGEVIFAETLLQENVAKTQRVQKETDAFNILFGYQDFMDEIGKTEKMAEQHVCLTIIKSDLLEKVDEIKNSDFASVLFANTTCGNVLENQAAREYLLEELFDEFVFTGEEQKDLLNEFESSSYHLVSALGCDTDLQEVYVDVASLESGKRVVNKKSIGEKAVLLGDFAPLRVAEPIMTCLQAFVEKNEW